MIQNPRKFKMISSFLTELKFKYMIIKSVKSVMVLSIHIKHTQIIFYFPQFAIF